MGVRQIVTELITHDKASKPLKDAGKAASETARNYDDLSAAEQRLALAAEKAGVAVDKAARAAARAEERFGKDSEQAREATRRLREAKLDLADAEDKVKRKAEESALATEAAARATKDADAKTSTFRTRLQALVPTLARNATGFSAMTAGARGLGQVLVGVLPVAGRVTAWTASIGSAALTITPIIGAFALKIGAAALQLGHLALAAAPAAASLPALAGGFLLVKGTAQLAGPAIMKALQPVTEAFLGKAGKVNGKTTMIGGLQEEIGKLATRGLPQLAQQFLKVNFPTIGQGMRRIAVAMNSVILSVGKWVNSIPGQRAIRTITEATATAVEKLAPHLSKLAIAFGNLVTAAGPGAFERVTKLLVPAADSASRFLGTITKSDVDKAWGQIDHYAGSVENFVKRLPRWGSAIMGAVRWWRAHATEIQHVRDVLAIVGVTIGLLTGEVIPVLIGGITLLINHWDDVTAALGRVKAWFHGTSDSANMVRGVIDGLQVAVGDLVSWFRDQLLPALERGARAVMPAIHDAIRMVTNTFHDNHDVIAKVQGVLTALGIVVTEAIIPALTFLAQTVIHWLGIEFSGLIIIVNRVVLPGLRILTGVVLDIFGAIVHGAADAFGWVPGLGPKLKDAAAKFDKFRDQVNGALTGIKDQKVTVGATIYYNDSAGRVGFKGSKAIARRDGGPIVGPGGPRDDQVLMYGSNGEFVVNAKQTSRHRSTLEAINAGRFRDGGLVVAAQTAGLAQTMAAERKALLATAKQMAPSISAGSVGSGVRQWAGLVAQVLAELGQPASALGAVLSRMQRESGGNPHAINLWDSNARAGDPSRGLLQTIGSTFNAFAGPYRAAGIYDPHANIYAGLNYAIHRYGSHWIARMTAPGGYDQGGVARHAGLIPKLTNAPERVLSPAQTVSFDRLTRVLARGGAGNVNVTVEVTASAAVIEDRVVEGVRSAVNHGRLSKAVIPPGSR